jgi:hypothetical protein
MTITLDLQPEIDRGLLAQAQAKGVSLADEVLAREAKSAGAPARRRTGQELIDACAQVQGVFTDEEIDRLFSRNAPSSRRIELE